MMTFFVLANGNELKRKMRERGITQYELSRRTGLSRPYICRILNMQTTIGANAQNKIKMVLKGIKFDLMFSFVDNPNAKNEKN